jgi:hypothetical protein
MKRAYKILVMRLSVKSMLSLVISSALIISSFAVATPAEALSVVKSIPAPWVYTYANPLSATKHISTQPTLNEKHAGVKSNFIVNYTGVPEIEMPAIQAALDAWASDFVSTVPIHVEASFTRQGYSGILASATPAKFFHGFKGAPDPDLWYPSAMANALAGKDLDPANPEIIIHINSTMANQFYIGTDGGCPPNQYDLESILLHEVGHGLGFLSNDSYDTFYGYGSIDQPTPYDAYAQLSDGRRLMDLPSPSVELGKALTSTIVWSGRNGVAANNGVKPKLYTPSTYQQGSSISHLDEATFSSSGVDSVMTPNLSAGEVFHEPGPLALAMMADMLLKPPAGVPTGIPTVVRNVKALIGDKSAVITFDPPTNLRTSQVSSYAVKVNQSGVVVKGTTSPIVVTGLKNGSNYSFSVTASNTLGTSEAATTNVMSPQPAWKSSVLDTVDAKHLVSGIYAKKQYLAYSDSKSGDLRFATLTGKSWVKNTIDGNASTSGKTKDDVSGFISTCIEKVGKSEILHLFYGDITEKDLRHASFDGTKWSYETVDGNGSSINDYKDPIRARSSSDVSVSSACAYTTAGLQVFYRDESQGILLGASQVNGKWNYELIDGDKEVGGRTTGDVGFHISASAVGKTVSLTYDSVLSINQDRSAIRGEVRQAVRSSIYPEDWTYSTLQASANGVAVAGFDVSNSVSSNVLSTAWLTASGIALPNADQLQWTSAAGAIKSVTPESFGTPAAPIANNSGRILFACNTRLCAMNVADQTISLVSTSDFSTTSQVTWIVISGKRYAVAGVDGKLQLFLSV